MKYCYLLATTLSLFILANCAENPATAQKKPVVSAYDESNNACSNQAQKKLSLFDRPDTYPISNQERDNARAALYNECMNANAPRMAGAPKSDTQQASTQSTAALAALSPAAGGNAAPKTNAYPSGSTVIMIEGNHVTPLGGLSPSAGGNPPQSGATGTYPGSTVVVVQGASASAPLPAHAVPEMPAALARPIPVANPPVATASLPAVPAAAPKSLPVTAGDQGTQQLEQILTK